MTRRSFLAGKIIRLSPAVYFGLFALMMVPVTIAFVAIARRFNALTGAPDV